MALNEENRYKLFEDSLNGEMSQIMLRTDKYWDDVFPKGRPEFQTLQTLYAFAEATGYALEVRFLQKQIPVPISQSQSGEPS